MKKLIVFACTMAVVFFWPQNPTAAQNGSFSLENEAGDTLFFVNDSGQVGINTTSPSYTISTPMMGSTSW